MADALTSESSAEVAPLARALAFSRQFQFLVLVSDFPRVTQVALGQVRDDFERLRGGPLAVEVFRPPPHAILATELPRLAQELTTWLNGPAHGSWSESPPLLVIDASGALEAEHPVWRQALARLNEARNTLSAELKGPLLLCLPSSLVSAATLTARDLWSIRGYVAEAKIDASRPDWLSPSAVTEAAERPREALPVVEGDYLAALNELTPPTEGLAPGEAEQWKLLGELRTTLPSMPQFHLNQPADMVSRLGQLSLDRGDLRRAAGCFLAAVALFRALQGPDPFRSFQLDEALIKAGWTWRKAGFHARAATMFEEAYRVSAQIDLTQVPIPLLRTITHLKLSIASLSLGDALLRLGDWNEADLRFRESLKWARETDASSREGRWTEIRALQRLAAVEIKAHHVEQSRMNASHALTGARDLAAQLPNLVQATQTLAEVAEGLARLEAEEGDLPKALALFGEALGTNERLSSSDENLRNQAALHSGVAYVHRLRGDPEAEWQALEAALALLEKALVTAPRSEPTRFDRAWILGLMGEAALRVGDHPRARALFERAEEGLRQMEAEGCWMDVSELKAAVGRLKGTASPISG